MLDLKRPIFFTPLDSAWQLTFVGRVHEFRFPFLRGVLIEIQGIDHRLWILFLLLFGDSRALQESRPEMWHAIEFSRRWIVCDMNRMIEVRWTRDR